MWILSFKSKHISLKIYKLSKTNSAKLIHFSLVLRDRKKNNNKYFAPQSPIDNCIHNSKVMFVLSVHWNLKQLLNLEIIEPNYVPSQKKPRRKLRKILSKIFHQQTVKVTKIHCIHFILRSNLNENMGSVKGPKSQLIWNPLYTNSWMLL